MISIASVHPQIHKPPVAECSFFTPTTRKTDLLARSIIVSSLMFFCGPMSGLINAVLIFGIELGVRALGHLLMKSHTQCFAQSKKEGIQPIAQPIGSISPIQSLLHFLKMSPNFATNPNYEKFILRHIRLPPESVAVDGNILTISLKNIAVLRLDPDLMLSEEEFLRMNRHTDTDNLLKLPDKCPNPRPARLPTLRMGNLNYFRSFGEIVTKILQTKKNISLGPDIILKLEGNTLEFVKGSLANICSVEFQPGWHEEQGLVAISSKMLFWSVTRLYFLGDISWVLSKLK